MARTAYLKKRRVLQMYSTHDATRMSGAISHYVTLQAGAPDDMNAHEGRQ